MIVDAQQRRLQAQRSVFVGHNELLRSLHGTLQTKHAAVLTGKHGSGKTALAREYARLFAHAYEHILWLDMATPEALLTSILIQSRHLPLPDGAMQKDFTGVNEILSTWANQPHVLLVLDNVTFPLQVLSTQEKKAVSGHVLLLGVSEARQIVAGSQVVEPPVASDCALLVTRPESEQQRDKALELAREMGCSLLALTLARGYLGVTGCSLQEYLFAYRDCPERSNASPDREAQTLEIAADLTLARLETSHPVALCILRACAFLSSDVIPQALFRRGDLWRTLFPGEAEPHADQLDEAIQVLQAYQLLETQDETDTLSIHPLLAAVLRRSVPQAQQRDLLERLMLACVQLARVYEQESEHTIPIFLFALAGHIRSLASIHRDEAYMHEEVAEACLWAALILGGKGLIRESEPLLSKAVRTWEQSTTDDARMRAVEVLRLQAIFNARLCQYAEAEAYAQRSITLAAEMLNINCFGMFEGLNTLADIYQQQGKIKEARISYEKTLSICERLGLQHYPLYAATHKEWLKLQ